MGKETKRSVEMRRVLEEYAASGLGRRAFCQQRGIALTTFDYWRREHAAKPRKRARRPRLVAVKVGPRGTGAGLCAQSGERAAHRMLVALADAELARLIRIAESA